MAIYDYNAYCNDEIPRYGSFVFAGDPLTDAEDDCPGAAYSEVGCQLAENSLVFCADDPFEAIAYLHELSPSFESIPQEFYLYFFEAGEVKALGRIGFGSEQIVLDLRIPVSERLLWEN